MSADAVIVASRALLKAWPLGPRLDNTAVAHGVHNEHDNAAVANANTMHNKHKFYILITYQQQT